MHSEILSQLTSEEKQKQICLGLFLRTDLFLRAISKVGIRELEKTGWIVLSVLLSN